MRRTVKNVVALVTVLLLVLITACAPAPGEVTPPPTPEPTPIPTQPTPTPTPTPTPSPVPEGNFRLLISDDVNAIGDFESLVVTITSVGVHMGGENGGWLERSPATEELDLVDLQEENAQEIWNGNLTDGQYTMVFVYVSDIDAILNNGDPVEMKLPSGKLHINTNFNIPEDSPINFVFDISVVAAGNEKSGIKYILKPVVSQSGPNQNFTEVNLQEREREREREREEESQEKLELELDGNIGPGETVTLLVTFDGEPVAGATVEVNDEEIDNTGDDGTVSFTIPEDAEELTIEATKGELKGELEIEFQEEQESELVLEIIDGDIVAGNTVTLLVTFDGEPVAGAEVEVNDEEIDNTGDDGTVSFTIPEDAGEVEIEARLDELKGELELEVEEG